MYNLYFDSATSTVCAMKVFLARHRRPFQSEIYQRGGHRAEDCVEEWPYEPNKVTQQCGRDAVTRWLDFTESAGSAGCLQTADGPTSAEVENGRGERTCVLHVPIRTWRTFFKPKLDTIY